MPSFCIHFCPLNRIKFVFIPLYVWFICRLSHQKEMINNNNNIPPPKKKRSAQQALFITTPFDFIYQNISWFSFKFLYKLTSWWFINLTEITKGVFYWPWIKVNGLNSRNHLFWRSLHCNIWKSARNEIFRCMYCASGPKLTAKEICNITFAYCYFGIRSIEPTLNWMRNDRRSIPWWI